MYTKIRAIFCLSDCASHFTIMSQCMCAFMFFFLHTVGVNAYFSSVCICMKNAGMWVWESKNMWGTSIWNIWDLFLCLKFLKIRHGTVTICHISFFNHYPNLYPSKTTSQSVPVTNVDGPSTAPLQINRAHLLAASECVFPSYCEHVRSCPVPSGSANRLMLSRNL